MKNTVIKSKANPELSATQAAAVAAVSREVCVSAAAGSGKTRVLVERFARAVLDRGIAPDRIIAITYTQKAADELRERIQRRLESAGRSLNEGREPAIGTIHGFCLRLLQENAIDAGLDPSFTVLQGDLYEGVMEEAIEEVMDEAMRGDAARFGPIFEYAEPDQLKKSLVQGYERARTLGRSPVPCPTMDAAMLRSRVKRWIDDFGAWKNRLPEKQSSKILEIPDAAGKFEDLLEALPELVSPIKSIRMTGAFKAEAGEYLEELEALIAHTADAIAAPYNALFAELMSRLVETVEARKRIGSWVDLHDLMDRVIELLERPAFRARVRADYAALLVDEYQDVNALQAKLLDRLGSELEVFVVGDARQAIYGFRHAESEFFRMRLERARSRNDGSAVEIPENYRSRPGVVNWINKLFQKSGDTDELFGKLDARREPSTGADSAVKILWSVPAPEGKPKADDLRRSDAAHAADAISGMVGAGSAKHGDIAVLLRGMTALTAYEEAFRQADIPYHVIRGRGFYEKSEVVDLVNLFRAVKNPDEPFYAAALLRSPFAALDDGSIRQIFYNGSKEKLTLEARMKRALADERSDRTALEVFWGWFAPLVSLRQELTLSQILERALAGSAFEAITLAQADGLRRFANVRKFKDALREFEGLYGADLEMFVARLEERMGGETAEEETEAAVASERGDAVRILTVHASKGLEFPVVVAADLSGTAPKNRNGNTFTVDDQARVVSNPPGAGDSEEDKRVKSASFLAYQERRFEKESEESLRLFYVAVTRAREKLVLCGSLPAKEKKGGSAKSWTDRVLDVFPEAAEGEGVLGSAEAAFAVRRRAAGIVAPIGGDVGGEREEELKRQNQTRVTAEVVLENLQDQSRPYRQTTDLSVSDLAEAEEGRGMREEGRGVEGWGEIPGGERRIFLAESGPEGEETLLGASSVGHLFHEMLQHAHFERDPREEATRILKDFAHRMDEAARPEFKKGLERFLSSKLAEDLRASERAGRPIYRELPFFYRMRADGREIGSIKGQVDLLFEAPDGKWTLVDYKTTVSEKPEHHHQLRIYAFCLKKLLTGRPHRAVLYYSRDGGLVPVDLTLLDSPEFEAQLVWQYAEVTKKLLVE